MSDTRTNSDRETVVVERGGSGAGLILGIALLIVVAVGAYFIITQNNSEVARDAAITEAAQSVGDAADKAGDAVDKNTK